MINSRNYDKDKNKIILSNKYSFMYWGDAYYDTAFTLDDFADYKEVTFEGIKCRAVKNYDTYLKKFYSTHYMKLPPVEEQVKTHKSVFYWNKRFK